MNQESKGAKIASLPVGVDASESAYEYMYDQFVASFGVPPSSALIGESRYKYFLVGYISKRHPHVKVFISGSISDGGLILVGENSQLLLNNAP